jgi:hypothetical protein
VLAADEARQLEGQVVEGLDAPPQRGNGITLGSSRVVANGLRSPHEAAYLGARRKR